MKEYLDHTVDGERRERRRRLTEIEQRYNQIESIGSSTADLELMRQEVQVLQRVVESLEVKRQQLMIELSAPPRIRLIQIPETESGS